MAEDPMKVNPRRKDEPESERMARVHRENSVWADYRKSVPEEKSEDKQMREAREAQQLGQVWVQCQCLRCWEVGEPFPVDRISPNFSPNTKIIARCIKCDAHSIRAHGEALVLRIRTVGGSVVTVQSPREKPVHVLAGNKVPGSSDWLIPTLPPAPTAENLPPIADHTDESARILNERKRDGRVASK